MSISSALIDPPVFTRSPYSSQTLLRCWIFYPPKELDQQEILKQIQQRSQSLFAEITCIPIEKKEDWKKVPLHKLDKVILAFRSYASGICWINGQTEKTECLTGSELAKAGFISKLSPQATLEFSASEKYDACFQKVLQYATRRLISFPSLDYDKAKAQEEQGNVRGAIPHYQKAHEQGDLDASYNLAVLYQRQKKYQKAIDLYLPLAKQNRTDVAFNLALCYQTQNQPKHAATYFKQAADAGLGEAQYNLALCYKEGLGVPKDLQLAAFYYKQAKENGVDQGPPTN